MASTDRTHLVAASTGLCKLLRRRTRGANVGTSEPFADLPGYPDNMRPDKGGYWVGGWAWGVVMNYFIDCSKLRTVEAL